MLNNKWNIYFGDFPLLFLHYSKFFFCAGYEIMWMGLGKELGHVIFKLIVNDGALSKMPDKSVG